MFKKNAWVVGLLAALAIMFAGCVDPIAEDNSGVDTEVFNLQEVLADAPLGVITDDIWGEIFGEGLFMMCGGVTNGEYSIIMDNGVKKVKVDKMGPTWGVGFDIYNARAAFKDGDTLYVKGSAGAPALIFNINTSGEKRLGDKEFEGAFEETFTLAAGDSASIRGGSPKAIRIHYKNNNGSERKGSIIIEQIILTGKRSAGEGVVEPPPPPYSVPGKGSYNVPASASDNEFYLDLNEMIIHSLTAEDNIPAASVNATTLTVNFSGSAAQTIFLPFSDEQRTAIINSIDSPVAIVIAGTGTANVRWCMGRNQQSDWNASVPLNEGPFNTILTSNHSINSGRYNSLDGIVLQSRNTLSTITITSIKITVTPVPPTLVSSVEVRLDQPSTAEVAPQSINGSGWVGAVTWFPALPSDGKFAAFTQYYAKIVLSPGRNAILHVFEVTGKRDYIDGDGDPQEDTLNLFYDFNTRTVTTAYFEATGDVPILPDGQLFDFDAWLAANVGNSIGGKDPFNQSGGPTVSIASSGDNKGITLTNIVNDYDAVDIVLKKVDFRLDPALYEIKVVVKGKVLALNDTVGTSSPVTVTSARMILQGKTSSAGYDEDVHVDDLVADDEFTLTMDEIDATKNWVALRVLSSAEPYVSGADTNNKAHVKSFIITSVEIINLGAK
jgi:hypothetical protein